MLPLCVHGRVHVRLIFASVWVTAAYGHTDGPLLLTSCSLVSQWHLFCVFKVHLLGNELSNTLRVTEESIHPQEFLLSPDLLCKSMPIGFIFKTEQRISTQETNKYYINNVEGVWFLWGICVTTVFTDWWFSLLLKPATTETQLCEAHVSSVHVSFCLSILQTFLQHDSNTNINASKKGHLECHLK